MTPWLQAAIVRYRLASADRAQLAWRAATLSEEARRLAELRDQAADEMARAKAEIRLLVGDAATLTRLLGFSDAEIAAHLGAGVPM
jgi:hypothetical protein